MEAEYSKHAHIVLAHPEPKSFNAHLAQTAHSTLERQGWTTTVSETIPFNKMAHWGGDGRVAADAPIYSPFIRRKEKLQLE